MKIQNVEELVGISKKNIRFYEDQGLLSPKRAENGYREYHEEDIQRLKQIKFLRKLYVPIEEIRLVFSGEIPMEQCLEHRLRDIEKQRADLDEIQMITEELLRSGTPEEPLSPDRLDIDSCLEKIARLEKEGKTFMDVNLTDIHRKKAVGSLIGASIMIAVMAFIAGMILWGNKAEPLPKFLFVLLMAIPVVIIVCIIVVLVQRIGEIQGGEEDEAAKY